MPSAAELPLEVMYWVREADGAEGTPVTPPTHMMRGTGTLTPMVTTYQAEENDGTLAEYTRTAIVRKWGEFELAAPLSIGRIMHWLESSVAGSVTPTTVVLSGITYYVYIYEGDMLTDTLRSCTIYWGDPNATLFQGAYGLVDEWTISADASSEEATQFTVKGTTQFPVALGSVPVLPALAQDGYGMLIPGRMQIWIDTSSAIATTAVTGRVISVEHTLTTGITYKYEAQGPTSTLSYIRHGRGKRHLETKIVLEYRDNTQYTLWTANTFVKCRVKHPAGLVAGSTYYGVTVDTYGKIASDFSWGDLEGTNRTIELLIVSGDEANVAASDFTVFVHTPVEDLDG